MKDQFFSTFETRLKEILSKVTPKRKSLEERTDLSKEFVDFLSVLKNEICSGSETIELIETSTMSSYLEELNNLNSNSPQIPAATPATSPQNPNSSLAYVSDIEFYEETSGDSGNSFNKPNEETPISFDSDAQTYIDNVEAADGQSLEAGVRTAINDFVVGCKADGIWNSILSSCILAGARTLHGALVPLMGSAPSNINFVSGDYNRLQLTGGTSKFLNSNLIDSSISQDDVHISTWQSQQVPSGSRTSIGVQRSTPYYTSSLIHSGNNFFGRVRNINSTLIAITDATSIGLFGASRNNSSTYNIKTPNFAQSASVNSTAPLNLPYYVFSGNNNGAALTSYHGALSFYSIGNSINLGMLNARVSALLTAIQGAI